MSPHALLRSTRRALLLSLGVGALAAPAQAADYEVTLNKVTCLTPATGIESDAVDFLDGFVDGFNMVWGPSSQFLSLAGPKASVAVAVVDGSIAAVSAGTDIAQAIDSDRAPDDLYVLMDGRKVLSTREVDGGETVDINASVSGAGDHTIALWEYDSGSDDDSLGEFSFTPNQPGTFTFEVISKEEGSHYLVEVSVATTGSSGSTGWSGVAGTLVDICAGDDDVVWGVNSSGDIYRGRVDGL